jgi:predicted ester cyclase
MPAYRIEFPRRRSFLTISTAAAVVLIFAAIIFAQNLNQAPNNNYLGVTAQPEQSAEERNLALFTRYMDEAWSEGNTDILEELLRENHLFIPGDEGEASLFPEAVAEQISDYHEFMSDLEFSVGETIVDDERVFAIVTMQGTPIPTISFDTEDGDTIEMTTRGERISVTGTVIVWIRDDQIRKTWWDFDIVDMLDQVFDYDILGDVWSKLFITEPARQFTEDFFGGANIDAADIFLADSVQVHMPDSEAVTLPGDSVKAGIEIFHNSFDNFSMQVLDFAVTGSTALVHVEMQGIFVNPLTVSITGEDVDIQPTNELVTIGSVFIYRFDDDGKLAEMWVYGDNALQRLSQQQQ